MRGSSNDGGAKEQERTCSIVYEACLLHEPRLPPALAQRLVSRVSYKHAQVQDLRAVDDKRTRLEATEGNITDSDHRCRQHHHT